MNSFVMLTAIVLAALVVSGCDESDKVSISVTAKKPTSSYTYGDARIYADGELADVVPSGKTQSMLVPDGCKLEACYRRYDGSHTRDYTATNTAYSGLKWVL